MPSTETARGAFSKLRRNLGDRDKSSTSLAESSNSDDQAGNSGLRASVDVALNRVKSRSRRTSVGDRRGSDDSPNRLSALVPGRKKQNSRQKRDEQEYDIGAESASNAISGNQSDSSLNLNGSGHSSLLTDDNSDHDGNPVRPPLVPRDSHVGYLTLSSPEISAQTIPVAAKPDTVTPNLSADPPKAVQSIPRIIEPLDQDLLPITAPQSRNTSPVGKLKSAFTREKIGSDTDSVKSASSGSGGLGGLFKPLGRKNSINNQENAESEKSAKVVTTESEKSQEKSAAKEERPETPKRQIRKPNVNTNDLPATPPNLTDAPSTVVTPPTPTDADADASTFAERSTSIAKRSIPTKSPSSVEGIRHRRAQSANLPSKLSQSIQPPLTPTLEEFKTPGGTLTQPTNATGFFSSVFSVAQRAADQLSSSINPGVVPGQKGKTAGISLVKERGGEEVIPGLESQPDVADSDGDRRQPAVETLGKGDLNFGHLGISETHDSDPMGSSADLTSQTAPVSTNDANKKAEEEAANRAVSAAYDKPISAVASQGIGGRPLSIASNDRLTLAGDQTPPRSGTNLDSIQRSGSVRSKLSGRRRRHRASSATAGTSNSIGAALAATATGLANPAINGAGHRLTGFAVASSKRNKDFHQLFRSVPEDDYLIEDYSAALQRDILLHGRLYVSEGHICFSSNILGWVTNLVISFDEVVSVEKKSTAVIFPNAIVIHTLHARNTFASFVARDSTYELLIGIWKISHPNLKSSLNGVTLDNDGTGDKTEVAEPEGSEESSDSGSEDEVYDEDADDDVGSFTDAGLAQSVAGSDIGDPMLSRKPSGAITANGAPQTNGAVPKGLEDADAVVTGAAVSADFPGPPAHDATQCSDEHYDKPLSDTTIPAPLGKVYSMMFGPASGTFMRKWLVEDQKSRELNLPDDKTGLDNEHKSLTFDYIKPLTGSVGPKQTKCITTNTLMAYDLEKAVTIDCSTQTPDVPSGSVFTTKTRYCLMWGPGNSTRLVATFTVEWTGKSWIRSVIDRSANDGQTEYVKALVAAIKAVVTTKPPVKGTAKKGKRKGKQEVFDAEEANAQREATVSGEKPDSPNWGVLEPLHTVLSPIISIVRPFITSQVVIAVLFVLLAYTWINPPSGHRGDTGGRLMGVPGSGSPGRLAAYEEIWRREESQLWDWLEDRVGLDGIYAPTAHHAAAEDDLRKSGRQKVLTSRSMGKSLQDERMSERQMDDAIRVTEERLDALKVALKRKKGEDKVD